MRPDDTSIPCPVCGKDFEAIAYWKHGVKHLKKFCSQSCGGTARRDSGSSLTEKFWKYVGASGSEDDCWTWSSTTNNRGYGKIFRSRIAPNFVLAHRLSYEIHHGPLPDGASVCHRCDNPPCCNPRHLFLGTHRQNMEDAAIKGRMHPGEQSKTARLTAPDVVRIRQRYAAGGITYAAIANEYGVGQMTICHIVKRTTWRHID